MKKSNEAVEATRKEHGMLNRRTVVQGAAWAVPVIAAAVGTPLSTTSRNPWNVHLTGGCVLDMGGTGMLAPGFRVVAEAPSGPIPPMLRVTETAAGAWSLTLPAPIMPLAGTVDPTLIPGAELAFGAFSLGYARAIVAATLVPAALAAHGAKVDGDLWVTPSNRVEYLTSPAFSRSYSGSGISQTVTLSCTWDIQRELELTRLVPGDSTYWGYFGALVPPDVTGVPEYASLNSVIQGLGPIPVIGPLVTSAWNSAIGSLSPQLALNVVGKWTDAGADDADRINNLFAFGCWD